MELEQKEGMVEMARPLAFLDHLFTMQVVGVEVVQT
jgi:hypothetical protein